MTKYFRTIVPVGRAVLAAALAIGLALGCEPDSSPEESEPTANSPQDDESLSPGDEPPLSSVDDDESVDEGNSDEEEQSADVDPLGGEVLEGEDAVAVVDAVAGSESEDGRRVATNLALRLAEDDAEFDAGAGWRVADQSGEEGGVRARFEAGDFVATFDYDAGADGVEPVDEAAAEVLTGRDDVPPPSFSVHPDAYDATAEKPEERWASEYREQFQQIGESGRVEAFSALLAHGELMEDATYLVVHRGGVEAEAFRNCQTSLDCRWMTSLQPHGRFDVAFEAKFDDHTVEMSWSVDLESETFSPRNPAARHLHQLRRPVEDLSLPFSESVAFDERGDDEEESEELPRLSDGEINDIINEEFGDIRRCVLSALDDTEPGGSTSWEVEFLIDTGGDVDAETVTVKEVEAGHVTDSEFGQCMKAIFVELEFPPLPTRRGVRYPVHVQ